MCVYVHLYAYLCVYACVCTHPYASVCLCMLVCVNTVQCTRACRVSVLCVGWAVSQCRLHVGWDGSIFPMLTLDVAAPGTGRPS